MTAGIIRVRLHGRRDDVTELSVRIARIPKLTATGLRENRTDPGVRGYLTVTIGTGSEKRHGNDRADA